MDQISTSELKTHCSEIIERVATTRAPVVITRRGRPIARLIPLDTPQESLFGFAPGFVTVHGDLLEPVEVAWEAAE